jgi:hypothetical protein
VTDPDQAPPELTGAIERALRAAIGHDDDALRTAMHDVADVSFPAGLGYACYTWARVAASAIMGSAQNLEAYNASGHAAAGVLFVEGDQIVNAEQTDPASRFVGRMIACALNDDTDAAIDIYASLDDDYLADCSVAMVTFAASMVSMRAVNDFGGTPGAVP